MYVYAHSHAGSHVNNTWARNPYYFLHVPPPAAYKPCITVTLSLHPIGAAANSIGSSSAHSRKSSWAKRQQKDPLGAMLGIYVFKAPLEVGLPCVCVYVHARACVLMCVCACIVCVERAGEMLGIYVLKEHLVVHLFPIHSDVVSKPHSPAFFFWALFGFFGSQHV
jgi:hypothetical protein